MQFSELVECFFLLVRSANTDIAKLIETICFADYAIFHIYLIKIYFESKYSKKMNFVFEY